MGAGFRKAAPCLHASSLAPTLCLLHSQLKTRFLFPRWGGKLFPTQSSLKSSGTPELVGKLEAGREEQGNLWKKAQEGSQVSAGREAQQGRQWQEAAQEAGARTPSGPLLSRCTPALSSWRTGRVWKGCQQSQSTQGTVEAGRAEELKAASLGTSGDSVVLQRRTKVPPLQPFIVPESSVNRERIKKIYIRSRGELQGWKEAQADTCHKASSKFHPLNVPSRPGSGHLDLLPASGP